MKTANPINQHNAGAQRVNVKHLLEAVRYNPETGALSWLPRPESHFTSKRAFSTWNTSYAGKPAFTTKTGNGYRKGTFNSVELLAHRVAWLLISGAWPEGDIDHVDGDRSNNAARNLRSVTRAENLRNRGWKGNRQGALGVYYHKASNTYAARIYVDGRAKSLGYFKTVEEAKHARIAAERVHGYHENHGRHI